MKLTAPMDEAGHVWHERIYSSIYSSRRIMCCMNCGFIKNPDRPNKPCPGPVGVELGTSRNALDKEREEPRE